MRFLSLVLSVLFLFSACHHQAPVPRIQRRARRSPPQVSRPPFYGADDFYQVRLNGSSREELRIGYLGPDHMGRWRRLACNQERRVCQAFLRRVTIFAVPLMDEHLWFGMGEDVCPQMQVRRNGRELRTTTLRVERLSCAYTFEQPPDERIHLGQRLVIIQ
jgi:hypothetical protein